MLLLLLACVTKDLPPPPSGDGGADTTLDGTDSESTTPADDTAPGGDGDSQTTDSDTTDTTDTTDTAPPPSSPLAWTGERPKNVLMIALDTARPDWFGRYDGRAPTPNLDALFEGSFVLDNHRSCSDWTWPSVLCFQSARSETELGFITDGSAMTTVPSASIVMADDVLRDAGWYTGMVTSNSFFSEESKTAVGFERQVNQYGEPGSVITESGKVLMDEIAAQDAPWYLHLHYFDPHTPYSPPPEYLTGLDDLESIAYDLSQDFTHASLNEQWHSLDEATRALVLEHMEIRYAGELSYFDDQIGEVLSYAESLGLLDDTLVVFWTDHGEQFFENGSWGHDQLYDVENRSIVSIRAPNLTPGTWSGPTAHKDIWPTLLDALELPPQPDFTGEVLGFRSPDSPLYALRYLGEQTQQTVVVGDKKLYYRWSGVKEYYDLGADPDEQVNAYDAADPDVLALWELLSEEVDAVQTIKPEYAPIDPGP